MEQIYDVFISYSRKDYLDDNQNIIPGNVVSTIKETLTKEGISFWFDEEGIYSGQNFIEKIVNNIESSRLFLYLSTTNANASKWTCKEIASANEFGKPIIPVRIDRSPYNKKVMFLISDLDYIEYYNNPEIGLRDMVLSIKAHLQSLNEEEERKKKEEEARREAEIKRLEEERRKKEEEERRRQEEQKRIVADIEFACAKLNTEEKKLDLDRGALLVDAERVSDGDRREQLKSFITSSSPIRQKLSEEIKKLQDQIAKLEADISAARTEKEHLEKTKAELKEKDEACSQLSKKVKELEKQLEAQTPGSGTSKPNKKLHLIYGAVILALLGCGIGLVWHWVHNSNYWENRFWYENSQLFDAEQTISELAIDSSIIVSDICVYNVGDDCGDDIISFESTYLTVRINTYSTEYPGDVRFDIKIFDPYGDLSANSSSPYGYSFSEGAYIPSGRDYCVVGRWGGSTPGFWDPGTYTIEVWYKGKMLKSEEFEIH